MSTEDIYEATPIHRVKDCGFIVVTNKKGMSDHEPQPTIEAAEAYARIERIKVGDKGSVKIVELKYMRGAA